MAHELPGRVIVVVAVYWAKIQCDRLWRSGCLCAGCAGAGAHRKLRPHLESLHDTRRAMPVHDVRAQCPHHRTLHGSGGRRRETVLA